jgi:hypothetical protein
MELSSLCICTAYMARPLLTPLTLSILTTVLLGTLPRAAVSLHCQQILDIANKQKQASMYQSSWRMCLHDIRLWLLLNILTVQCSASISFCQFVPCCSHQKKRKRIKNLSSNQKAKPVKNRFGKWFPSQKPQRPLITICQ